jgi:glucose/arabinose dehydrogenase
MDMRFFPFFLFAFVVVACNGSGCAGARRTLVSFLSPSYEPEENPAGFVPLFEGRDAARNRIDVGLRKVAGGFNQITDLQFVPGAPALMVVLEKEGRAVVFDRENGERREWFKIQVVTDSEAGLLGLAFHPAFEENGKFYLNYVKRSKGADISRIAEWKADPQNLSAGAQEARVLLEVEQPYANHNAGQLAFGPDGYLYIGWGDGGWMNDPHSHGQNPATLLGAMLRIDVDRQEDGKPYAVPADNPFVGKKGYLPEVWAFGLRNPWRYSFDRHGRLIVADVGQDLWEEVSVVSKGDNLGWNIREGKHCFEPKEKCKQEGLTEPVYEYGREDGSSITGGYVYEGNAVPALRGKYVFGDFVSGRLWAMAIPSESGAAVTASTLGKWPILPSTFGQDAEGEVYVGSFVAGDVYQIVAGE